MNMASRKSKKTPPRLDEIESDDLEAEFLAKLGGYESKARVSERFSQLDDVEAPQRKDSESPPSPTQEDAGFDQFRAAFEATDFAASVESSGSPDVDRTAEAPLSDPDRSEKRARRVTHAEMMEEAFDSIGSDAAVHANKFDGSGYGVGEDVEIVDDLSMKEELASPRTIHGEVELSDDDMLFFEMMAADDVRPGENSRIAPTHGRGDIPDAAKWHSVGELRTLSEKDLLEPTLTHEQRARLKRSRKHRMSVINIRQSRREEALAEVKAFVAAAYRREIPYVRIITGKGNQSEGLPVLKRAVIEWVEQYASIQVRGWAPETDRGGNYGSVVLEIAARGDG